MTGRIFDIKEFSVQDGPGNRVTVFLKGCPLSCPWCHNPEGQRPQKELMEHPDRCAHCGLCLKPNDSESFAAFGRNVSACPQGLLKVVGEDITPEELLERLLPFRRMLANMDGGITFSGGEPLAQPGFFLAAASLLRENGFHVAVETSGFCTDETFDRMLSCVDEVLMDLKIMDPQKHLAVIGVPNDGILRHAKTLMDSGVAHVFRTPLIPGYTDDEANLAAIRAFVGASAWETLKYNPMAGAKYPLMGRVYPLGNLS